MGLPKKQPRSQCQRLAIFYSATEPWRHQGLLQSTATASSAAVGHGRRELVASGGAVRSGTSISATSPDRSGESTTGFYTAASGEVDLAVKTTGQIMQWLSTGENIVAGGLNIGGSNAISFNSADSGSTGSSIAIGPGVLSGQTSSAAYGSTGVGYQALHGTMTTAAIGNTALGFKACDGITTGNGNTCIGYETGDSISTAVSNVYIGQFIGGNGNNSSYNVVIDGEGNQIASTGGNNVQVERFLPEYLTAWAASSSEPMRHTLIISEGQTRRLSVKM